MLTRVRGTISLATNPGSLVRFAFHDVVDWQPWMDSRHQPPASKASALRLSYRVIKKEKCPRQELHPHLTASETVVSAVGLHGKETGNPGWSRTTSLLVQSQALC